jgi:hypothetical protein
LMGSFNYRRHQVFENDKTPAEPKRTKESV